MRTAVVNCQARRELPSVLFLLKGDQALAHFFPMVAHLRSRWDMGEIKCLPEFWGTILAASRESPNFGQSTRDHLGQISFQCYILPPSRWLVSFAFPLKPSSKGSRIVRQIQRFPGPMIEFQVMCCEEACYESCVWVFLFVLVKRTLKGRTPKWWVPSSESTASFASYQRAFGTGSSLTAIRSRSNPEEKRCVASGGSKKTIIVATRQPHF